MTAAIRRRVAATSIATRSSKQQHDGVVKILHVASHNINVGDGALNYGIRKFLSEVADRTIDWHELDIVSLSSIDGDVPLIAEDLRGFDLVLVGGGGTIDGHVTHNVSGMAFPMCGAEIRRASVPIAFVGVGFNLFDGQKLHHQDKLAEVLSACAERGFPFSVRNDSSLERLSAAVGTAAERVSEVPDPGFFIEPDHSYTVPQMTTATPKVIVQVAGDNLERRLKSRRSTFGRKDRSRKRFITSLANLVTWLVEQFDGEVIFAPHITRDLAVTAEILDQIPNKICRFRTRVLGVAHPTNAPQFFSAYAKADLVIGMRGHSVICAVGLGVPCLAISTHQKVRGFVSRCGLDEWSVDWSKEFDLECREKCHDLLCSPRRYHEERTKGTSKFRARFRQFMIDCWELGRE